MERLGEQTSLLQQLMGLHEVDQQILALEREMRECRQQQAGMDEGVVALESRFERLDGELQRARAEARASERALDEKRDTLDRLRTRVNSVQNERQYSAASLEFDLVRQDLRKLEDLVINKLQAVEELEGQHKELSSELEAARTDAGPRGEEITARVKELQDELAIVRDKRNNLTIRIDSSALSLYERIAAGRSRIALAPLTDEGVCGNCFTSVTIQQEMQIKGMNTLICCEGCGVILYPGDLKR